MAYQMQVMWHCMPPSRCASPGRSAAEGIPSIIDATVGRIIFNEPIPQDLGYVDRTDPEQAV